MRRNSRMNINEHVDNAPYCVPDLIEKIRFNLRFYIYECLEFGIIYSKDVTNKTVFLFMDV